MKRFLLILLLSFASLQAQAIIRNSSTERIVFLMVDAGDNETGETGLTQITVQISKNGGSFTQVNHKQGGDDATSIGNGFYYFDPWATETNTNGPLIVRATSGDPGQTTNEWRSIYLVTNQLPADIVKINANTDAVTSLLLSMLTVIAGDVNVGASPTTTSFETDQFTARDNNDLNGALMTFRNGTLNGVSRIVTTYTATNGVFDFTDNPWPAAPSNDNSWVITPFRADVNVNSISGDTTAADNLESFTDGTGYAGGTAKLGVDVVAISGDATAADNHESYVDGTKHQPVDARGPHP